MKALRPVGFVVLFLLFCNTALSATATRFELPGHGMLALRVPTGWDHELRKHPGDFPPTLLFTGFESTAFVVMVTPRWASAGDPADFNTPKAIRAIVEKAAHAAQPQALEERLSLVTVGGGKGPGYYFTATDRAPKPGEFKYMTQGAMRVGSLVCTFTILTNDAKSKVPTEVLNMLSGATQRPD